MKMILARLLPSATVVASLTLLSLVAGRAAEKASPERKIAGISIAEVKRTQPVDFQAEILPVLKNNCLACHNQTKAKAELVLETPRTILKGGESGPAVVPGKGLESLLLQAAAHQTDTVMPPRDNKVNASDLTPEQLGLIKLWIDQGAKGEVRAAPPIAWKPLPEVLQPILAVAVTGDGQYAACGRANRISIYHLPSKQLVTRLTDPQLIEAGLYQEPGVAHRDLVNSLAFNPEGTLLASGDYRQVKLWRRPRDVQKLTLGGSLGRNLQTLAVSSDGHWLAVARDEKEIKLFRLPKAKDAKILTGHEKKITALAFSPDGTKLASGSEDKSVRVWDVREGELFSRGSSSGEVRALVWLTDGTRIATGGPDPMIQLWKLPETDRGDLAAVKELKGHQGAVTSLQAIGTNGTELLSGSADGSIRHWNVETGKSIREMKHGAPVTAVAVRGDGRRFASSGSNTVAKLWEAQSGQMVAELKGDRYASELVAKAERELAFANSEINYRKTTIATAETQHKAQVERGKKATDALATAEKALLEKQKQVATAAEAKAAADKALAELNSEIKKTTDEYRAAEQAAQKAVADAKAAVDQALKAKVQSEQATDSKVEAQARAAVEKAIEEAAAKALAQGQLKPRFDQLTSEGPKKKAEEKLAAATKAQGDADKEFKKTELAKATAENELQLSKLAETQAADALTAAKSALVSAEEFQKQTDGQLKAAKAAAAKAEIPIHALAFSPDIVTLATAGAEPSVRTWSAESGAPFETLNGHKGPVAAVAFAGDGGLVSGSTEPGVIIWELNSAWKLERMLGTGDASSPLADRVNALQFSPDGQRLATGSGEPTRGGEIKIWEMATGKVLQDFATVHSDAVFSLDFTADGKYLASGAADKFVRVVELETGKLVKSFEGHTHHVLGVSWKRDGRTLMSAGADNVIKVWDFITGERKKNIDGFSKEVTGVSFIGATDQAVACSGDNQVRIVKENGDKVRSFEGVADFMYSVAATPDGKTVVAGGQDGVLRVWNGVDGKSLANFDAPSKANNLAKARTQ